MVSKYTPELLQIRPLTRFCRLNRSTDFPDFFCVRTVTQIYISWLSILKVALNRYRIHQVDYCKVIQCDMSSASEPELSNIATVLQQPQ